MRPGDTIAAIATATGPAPLAIVRISGPGVPAAIGALCLPTPTADPRGSAIPGRRAGGDSIAPWSRGVSPAQVRTPAGPCPALVVRFRGPESYTGEHAAELVLPGNPELLRQVLATLLDLPGVRAAGPGEFTARAFVSGRLSLDQAEGVALLVRARDDREHAAGRALLEGRAGARATAWADELAALLALVEAGIDFTDQDDVVPIAPSVLRDRLAAVRRSMGDEIGRAPEPRPGFRIVLAGPPNAGKSTLFNALLGQRRAVTSDRAGSTRDALVEPLALQPGVAGAAVLLVDTPGASPERIDRAQADALSESDLVVWCDAAAREPTMQAHVLVRTKADRPGAPSPAGWLPVCALDGTGLDALRAALLRIVDAAESSRGGEASALAPRHAAAVRRAVASLAQVGALIGPDGDALPAPELLAAHLRAALDAVGEITGRTTPDEVLARVFASFCIGK